MNRRTLLAAVLVTTASTGQVAAADVGKGRAAAPPPAAPAQPADTDQWSGVYLGLEGGGGWGRQSFDSPAIGDNANGLAKPRNGTGGNAAKVPGISTLSGNSKNGGMVGGFAGVQKQYGNWVLGVEGDSNSASVTGSSRSSRSQNGVGPATTTGIVDMPGRTSPFAGSADVPRP